MHQLSKEFRFEAAHTLSRSVDAEASRRVHGHSYVAVVTLRGQPDPDTGMLIDLGLFERRLNALRDDLDHRLLDDVPDLKPATIEMLAQWIWCRLQPDLPELAEVAVGRPSLGDRCVYSADPIS